MALRVCRFLAILSQETTGAASFQAGPKYPAGRPLRPAGLFSSKSDLVSAPR